MLPSAGPTLPSIHLEFLSGVASPRSAPFSGALAPPLQNRMLPFVELLRHPFSRNYCLASHLLAGLPSCNSHQFFRHTMLHAPSLGSALIHCAIVSHVCHCCLCRGWSCAVARLYPKCAIVVSVEAPSFVFISQDYLYISGGKEDGTECILPLPT